METAKNTNENTQMVGLSRGEEKAVQSVFTKIPIYCHPNKRIDPSRLSKYAATVFPLYKLRSLNKWEIHILQAEDLKSCNQFVDILIERGRKRGMIIKSPTIKIIPDFNFENYAGNFERTQSYSKPDFVLVLLNSHLKVHEKLAELMKTHRVLFLGLRTSSIENVGELGHVSIADYIIFKIRNHDLKGIIKNKHKFFQI